MIFKKNKVIDSVDDLESKSVRREAVAMQSMIAKKAFKIVHNSYEKTINEGDDLSDVPAVYWPNLISEGVL